MQCSSPGISAVNEPQASRHPMVDEHLEERFRLLIESLTDYAIFMVRRDEAARSPSASGCSSPAGESPVPVSAGAPGSRPQASARDPAAQAGCQKPLRREQVTRAATSSEACSLDRFTIREPSRSCHGEGNICAPVRRCTCASLGGVWGAARVTRRSAEHERPVCAAVVAARRLV